MVNLGIKSDGTVVIMDENNAVITNESVLRKIKQTELYKNQLSIMMSQFKEQIENETREFVEIYKLSQPVETIEVFQEALLNLKPDKYVKTHFGEIEPTNEIVKAQLEFEAKEKIKSLAFWKINKLRKKYVDDEIASRFSSVHSAWESKKYDYEQIQNDEEARINELYQKEYVLEKDRLTKAIEGNKGLIQSEIDNMVIVS